MIVKMTDNNDIRSIDIRIHFYLWIILRKRHYRR